MLDFGAVSTHFNHISSLNAVRPQPIEKRYSSGGGGRVQTHRRPCYKKAFRGSCEDQNCRFSHEQRDIEKLQGDPGYVAWCQRIKENSLSSGLEAMYQIAAADIENPTPDLR